MSTMSATVHGFSVSDAYIVKYGRKYLCAKWLAFTLHDRVFTLAAALNLVYCGELLVLWISYSFYRVCSIFKGENPTY